MVVRVPSVKMIVACAVVAIAMTACSSSSKSSSSGTTPKPVSAADFCAKIQSEADAFHFTSVGGKSPQELKNTYSTLADKLERLQSSAPSAIQDDFSTFVTFSKRIRATLADANYDPTKLSISDLAGLFSTQTLTAIQHISAYLSQNCHFTSPTS
jgi:hypothetical protein